MAYIKNITSSISSIRKLEFLHFTGILMKGKMQLKKVWNA